MRKLTEQDVKLTNKALLTNVCVFAQGIKTSCVTCVTKTAGKAGKGEKQEGEGLQISGHKILNGKSHQPRC